jgi:alpha-tubulin suppressor-like RCC1 family protein
MRRLLPFLVLLGLVVAAGIGGMARSTAAAADALPEAVISGIAAVDGGTSSTCLRTTLEGVRCWGENTDGQLGDGTHDTHYAPVDVLGPDGSTPLSRVRQLAVGATHACALLDTAQVVCWGQDLYGQVGDGGATDRTTATPVLAVSGPGRLGRVTQISAGGDSTCARLRSGQVRCWGRNEHGQLGNGATTDFQPRPVVVRNRAGTTALTGVTQVAVGGRTTCARLTSGQARCWGRNNHGQVGDGSVVERHRPAVVRATAGTGALLGVTQVAASGDVSCARLANRQARCWGFNGYGGLGDGTDDIDAHPRPVVVRRPTGGGPLVGVVELALGENHACARVTSGHVRCWGWGLYGVLGHGDDVQHDLPVAVLSPSGSGELGNVRSLGTGSVHTCARSSAGTMHCWGHNDKNQLGHGGVGDQSVPILAYDS